MTDFRKALDRLQSKVKCRHVAIDIAAQHLGISTAEISLLYQGIRKTPDGYAEKLATLEDNPPHPGYITVLMLAKHRRVSKAAVHKWIVDGKVDKPVQGSHKRFLWTKHEDAKKIWESWLR